MGPDGVPPLRRKTADGDDRFRSSRNAIPVAMSNVAFKRVGDTSIADMAARGRFLPVARLS
jgi:hypothetical protein